MEHFDPAVALRLIGAERLTIWGSVPSVFQMQLALPEAARCDFSSIELILWEGAALPEQLITRLVSICPRLATNYGLTETTSAVTIVAPTSDPDVLANTVGYPFESVEIRLVDADGEDVSAGREGEIWTRSIYNMLGYWRRPDETALALLPGGWLRTGDLAVRRSDGRYRIVGRLKEMYKSGGYNVYPREVERVIETHPAVSQAAVVGIPDPLWQEVGVAYVVLREHTTPQALAAHCRDRLANYKVPKRFELRDTLPLLPIGKIDKLRLRLEALADIPASPDHQDPNGIDLRA
jgi:acyl-CoA synthetase (AMP-forming)/AMP-acid ligase II